MGQENHEQEVGYRPPESANDENQRLAGSNAYPSEQEQKEAARHQRLEIKISVESKRPGFLF